MGSQTSQEYQSLVYPFASNQYNKLQDRGDFHIWEDRISTRKFIIYPTHHWEALSQHNLQVYHFRKLNRAYLAGIHGVLKEDSNICNKNNNSWVMVEHLPYSLADFSRKLAPKETISLLQALLAGYRLMSYIFGPLIATEERVFFTQIGVPKVWANQRLNLNQPSQSCHYHTMDTRESSLSEGQNITDRRSKSIKSIIRVVANNSSQGIPKKLQNELKSIKSYEQGQQILQLYCKSNRIQICENICIADKTSKLTLHKSAMSKLSFSSESQKPIFSRIPSYAPFTNVNFQRPEQQPPIKTMYHPPRVLPELKNNYIQLDPTNYPFSIHQNLQPLHNNTSNSPVITPQSVVTETLITSVPTDIANGRSQLYRVQLPPYFENRLSQRPVSETLKMMRQPQNILNDRLNARLPNVEIVLSQQTQSSISKELIRQQRQGSHITDSIQNHSIEETIQNPNYIDQYQIEQKNSQVYHSKELNGQEQNQNINEENIHTPFQRPHIKVSYQSSQNYRSQERDQVIIPQLYAQKQADLIQNFKSEEQLQKYVRNKYSEYFQEQKANRLHTSSQQKQAFQKKVTFSQKILMQAQRDCDQQEFQNKQDEKKEYFYDNDAKKITFGNINSKQQIRSKYDYQNRTNNVIYPPHKNENMQKNKNPSNQSINEKYSKYVLNKSANTSQKRGDAFQKSIFNKQTDNIRQNIHKRSPY